VWEEKQTADADLLFVDSKVIAGMLHKHVILHEAVRVEQEVNSLACSQFALQMDESNLEMKHFYMTYLGMLILNSLESPTKKGTFALLLNLVPHIGDMCCGRL